jgi:CheY-like chemotaxis protein
MNLLATMEPRQFDLILLDWRLPGISGDQVAKAYIDRIDRDQRVPLVFLSTAMPPDARAYAHQAGCLVLEKPIDLGGYEELARYLRSLSSREPAV